MPAEGESNSIRKLNEDDFEILFSQQSRAYPTFFRSEGDQQERVREAVRKSLCRPDVTWFGLFDESRLMGSMRFHDFVVNFRGAAIRSGGVGGVAVDMVDKKKRLAKRMMEYYIEHYRTNQSPLGLLWPFRPDFYHKMGFGYGGRVYRYNISPGSFPDSDMRTEVRVLGASDEAALGECYDRYARSVTGAVLEPDRACPKFAADALKQGRVVGYGAGDRLDGFLIYQFGEKEKTNFLEYDLFVTRFVCATPDSLAALASFLRVQGDQVRHVIIDLADDSLHYLLSDPRDTSGELVAPVTHVTGKVGLGIMYRVFDVEQFFECSKEARFGDRSIVVQFEISDSFIPSNEGSYAVAFEAGGARLKTSGKADVRITLDMSDFSSLLMGAVTLERLVLYGRAKVSAQSRVGDVDDIFRVTHQPVCLHPF